MKFDVITKKEVPGYPKAPFSGVTVNIVSQSTSSSSGTGRIRPLFYYRRNGRMAFASEIKALFADPDVERQFITKEHRVIEDTDNRLILMES